MASDEYILHTYFRSSCSARVRIALNVKGLPYQPELVNILKDEHKSEQNAAMNPSGVPTLEIRSGSNAGTLLTQSLAILEYIEETHDATPLLPPTSDSLGRAYVRSLANIVSCDIQPVTNMRILRRVRALGASADEWANSLMDEGLAHYEKLATKAGKFSYGDQMTLADVCLVPAVWGAVRFGVDVGKYPTVQRVYEEMSKNEGVDKAKWSNQPDCPEELRGK